MLTPNEALAHAARLFEAGDYDQAEAIYRKFLALEPRNAGFLRMLGLIERKRDRLDDAIALLSKAVEHGGDRAINHFELGNVYIKAGREADALPHFARAVELNPNYGQACTNIGAILEHQERYEEAEVWCRKAVELSDDCPISHYNLGNVQRELGDLRGALASFERSIELCPDGAKAHWNSAFCHLALGDFAAGWREYEWRERAGEVTIDRFRQPRWNGEPLAGKSIIVHAEQGIGDEILFASCLGDIVDTAARTYAVCEPRLARLFARSFPKAKFIGWQRLKSWEPPPLDFTADYQIPAGSVPRFVRPSAKDFPRRSSFLLVDASRRGEWRDRLDALGDGLKIGVSWQAGGQPVERRRRTTSLDMWGELLRTPKTRFVSLQYGDPESQLADARERLGLSIHHFADCDPLVDMDDFAALVSALDLVISVGNATVHLAGAVGTPAWTLLPFVPSWRWMSKIEQSVWYSSVRLIRQPRRGDWRPVFERVTHMLNDRVGQPGSDSSRRSGIGFSPAGDVIVFGRANPPAERAPAKPSASIVSTTPTTLVSQPPEGAFDHVSKIPVVFEAALSHHQQGRHADAESLLKQILDHTPRHANALHLMGVVQRRMGRPDQAERYLRRAVSVAPSDAQILCHLADTFKDSRKYEEAVSTYRQSIAAAPTYVEPRVHLGNLFQKMGRRDEARVCYQEAIAIDANCAEAHNALGAALVDAGDMNAAADSFQKALAARPDYFAALNNLGRVHLAMRKPDEAIKRFLHAAELAPDSAATLANMAQALVELGQLESAERALRHAIQLSPETREYAEALDRLLSHEPRSGVMHRVDAKPPHGAALRPHVPTRFVPDGDGGGTLVIGEAMSNTR